MYDVKCMYEHYKLRKGQELELTCMIRVFIAFFFITLVVCNQELSPFRFCASYFICFILYYDAKSITD